MKPLQVLGISVVATLLLAHVYELRFIAYPLLLFSTVPHEMGHGIAAVLMGGRFHELLMSPDGSGVAYFSGVSGRFALAFVSAAGLLGPAVAAALGFRLAWKASSARTALAVSSVCCLLAVLLVVRGVFAMSFMALCGLLLGWLSRKASLEGARLALTFLATQLSLSCFLRSDYLFTRYAAGGPSDVEVIAQNLFLPFWFWGGAIALLNLAILAYGLRPYVRGES